MKITIFFFIFTLASLSLLQLPHLVLVGEFPDLVAVVPLQDRVQHLRALLHRRCVHLPVEALANYQEVALISCYKEVNTLFQKILHKKFIWDKNASHRVFDQLSCVRQCFDLLVALQLFGD